MTGPSELAWVTDHTYVVLDDGSLFCVTGNQNTITELLGCLYYTPITSLHEWHMDPRHPYAQRPVTAPDGTLSYKIGPVIALDPARFARPLEARGIRWWPSTHLQAVARERITQVLDPVDTLANLLSIHHDHQCPLDTLTRLVTMAITAGVSLNRIGLTGSAAFNDANICGARDIDLVLIHPVRFATLAAATQGAWQPLAQLDAADSRRRNYLAERLPHASITTAETHAVTTRRMDVGWAGQLRIDLTEVAPPGVTQQGWPFDLPSLGVAEVTGTVTAVGDGYPFLLNLAGHDSPITVTRRGWQGVLRVGDRVLLRGAAFDNDGRPLLVVDNRSDHGMHLLVL